MKKVKYDGVLDQTTIMLKDPDQEESVYVIDDEKFGLMSNFESTSQIPSNDGHMAFDQPDQ